MSLVYALLNEHYSIVYLDCIAVFKVLYHWNCTTDGAHRYDRYWHVYTLCMSPTVKGAWVIHHFEPNNVIATSSEIMIDFHSYPRLSYIVHFLKAPNYGTWLYIPLVFMKHQWTISPCEYRQTCMLHWVTMQLRNAFSTKSLYLLSLMLELTFHVIKKKANNQLAGLICICNGDSRIYLLQYAVNCPLHTEVVVWLISSLPLSPSSHYLLSPQLLMCM